MGEEAGALRWDIEMGYWDGILRWDIEMEFITTKSRVEEAGTLMRSLVAKGCCTCFM